MENAVCRNIILGFYCSCQYFWGAQASFCRVSVLHFLNNYPDIERKGSQLLQNVTNYLPIKILNNSDLPQHCHENIRYGKCWPDDKIKLLVTLNSIVFQMFSSCIQYSFFIQCHFPQISQKFAFSTCLMYNGSTTFTKFVHLCSRLNRCQIVPKRLLPLQTYTPSWSFFPPQKVQNKHSMLTSSVLHQNIAHLS